MATDFSRLLSGETTFGELVGYKPQPLTGAQPPSPPVSQKASQPSEKTDFARLLSGETSFRELLGQSHPSQALPLYEAELYQREETPPQLPAEPEKVTSMLVDLLKAGTHEVRRSMLSTLEATERRGAEVEPTPYEKTIQAQALQQSIKAGEDYQTLYKQMLDPALLQAAKKKQLSLAEAVERARKSIPDDRQEIEKRIKALPSKTQRYLARFIQMAPQMGFIISSGILFGPGGAGVAAGPQIMGNTFDQVYEKTGDAERAMAAGAMNMLMQAPLEALGAGKILSVWKPQRQIIERLRDIAAAAGTEWFTEFSQGIPELVTTVWGTDPSMEKLKQWDAWTEALSQSAYEGLLTAPWALIGLGGGKPSVQKGKADLTGLPEDVVKKYNKGQIDDAWVNEYRRAMEQVGRVDRAMAERQAQINRELSDAEKAEVAWEQARAAEEADRAKGIIRTPEGRQAEIERQMPEEAPETWELTRDEFMEQAGIERGVAEEAGPATGERWTEPGEKPKGVKPEVVQAYEDHFNAVFDALNQGYNVPDDVLLDYPLLLAQKRAAQRLQQPPQQPTQPAAEETRVVPGRAWINRQWQPIVATREIAEGENEGKIAVALPDGQTEIVDRADIRAWPEEISTPPKRVTPAGQPRTFEQPVSEEAQQAEIVRREAMQSPDMARLRAEEAEAAARRRREQARMPEEGRQPVLGAELLRRIAERKKGRPPRPTQEPEGARPVATWREGAGMMPPYRPPTVDWKAEEAKVEGPKRETQAQRAQRQITEDKGRAAAQRYFDQEARRLGIEEAKEEVPPSPTEGRPPRGPVPGPKPPTTPPLPRPAVDTPIISKAQKLRDENKGWEKTLPGKSKGIFKQIYEAGKTQPEEVTQEYEKRYGKKAPPVLVRRDDDKRGVLIHPSTKRPGRWQVTYWDEDGFSGDTNYATKQEAIGEAYKEGFQVPAPKQFGEISATDRFMEGNEKTELVQRENAARMLLPDVSKKLGRKLTVDGIADGVATFTITDDGPAKGESFKVPAKEIGYNKGAKQIQDAAQQLIDSKKKPEPPAPKPAPKPKATDKDWENLLNAPQIAAAAIKMKDGSIVTGNTHLEAFQSLPMDQRDNVTDDDGFVDQDGKYLTREEAGKLIGQETPDAMEAVGRPLPKKPPAAPKKTEPPPKPPEAKTEAPKTKPGRAWVNDQWRPIMSTRKITRGKNKGKYEVTLPKGQKKIVEEADIKTWPEEAAPPPKPPTEAKKPPPPKPVAEKEGKPVPVPAEQPAEPTPMEEKDVTDQHMDYIMSEGQARTFRPSKNNRKKPKEATGKLEAEVLEEVGEGINIGSYSQPLIYSNWARYLGNKRRSLINLIDRGVLKVVRKPGGERIIGTNERAPFSTWIVPAEQSPPKGPVKESDIEVSGAKNKTVRAKMSQEAAKKMTPKQQRAFFVKQVDEAMKTATDGPDFTFTDKEAAAVNRIKDQLKKETEKLFSAKDEAARRESAEKTHKLRQRLHRVEGALISRKHNAQGTVTIMVPDDGEFTVLKDKTVLAHLKKQAKEFDSPERYPAIKAPKPTKLTSRINRPGVQYYNEFAPRKQGLRETTDRTRNIFDKGYFSDSSYIVKLPDKVKPKKPTSEKHPDLAEYVEKYEGKKGQQADIVGEFMVPATAETGTGVPLVHVRSKSGRLNTTVQAAYVDSILTLHPNATVSMVRGSDVEPVMFKDQDGKVVGLVMPFRYGETAESVVAEGYERITGKKYIEEKTSQVGDEKAPETKEGLGKKQKLVDTIKGEKGESEAFNALVEYSADMIRRGYHTLSDFIDGLKKALGNLYAKVEKMAARAFVTARRSVLGNERGGWSEKAKQTAVEESVAEYLKKAHGIEWKPNLDKLKTGADFVTVHKEVDRLADDLRQHTSAKETDKAMGWYHNAFSLPYWLAKRYRSIRHAVETEMAAQEARSEELTRDYDGPLGEVQDEMQKDQQAMGELRDLIWQWDGTPFPESAVPTKWYKEPQPGQDIEINPQHYEQVRAYLKKQGASDKVADAFVVIRQKLDEKFVDADRWMRKNKVDDPNYIQEYRSLINKIHNYFPHRRWGNRSVVVKNKTTGKTVYREHYSSWNPISNSTQKVMDRTRKWVQAAVASGELEGTVGDYEIRPPKKVQNLPDELFFQVPVESMQQLVSEAGKRLTESRVDTEAARLMRDEGLTEKEAYKKARYTMRADMEKALSKAVADVFKARGWAQHAMNRENIPGFDKEDIFGTLFDYLAGYTGFKTKIVRAREHHKTLTEISARERPEEYRYLSQYIRDNLENQTDVDRAVDMLRGVFFVKYLGFVVKSGFVNSTQNFVLAAPTLSQYTKGNAELKIGRAMKDVRRAVTSKAAWTSGKVEYPGLKADEQRAIETLVEQGAATDLFLRELKGSMPGRGRYGRMAKKFVDRSGIFMQLAEKWNRASTGLAAYRVGRDELGMDEVDAIEFAKEVIYDSHFLYGKLNLPSAMRGGPVRKIVRSAYTFRTFTHNYLSAIAHMIRNQRYAAAARSLRNVTLIGGLASFPFFKAFTEAMQWALGDDDEDTMTKIIGWMPQKWMRDLTVFGLPGVFGYDISGSLGIDIPRDWGELLGVPYAAWEDTVRMTESWKAGQKFRAISESPITPIPVRNAMRGWELYNYDSGADPGCRSTCMARKGRCSSPRARRSERLQGDSSRFAWPSRTGPTRQPAR